MKRISGLMVLLFLLLAAPSSAGEARLWACHGPGGEALGSQPIFRAVVGDAAVTGGCDLPGSALTGAFTRPDPNGQSQAKLLVGVPDTVALSAVRLDRTAQGPGYAAGTLETAGAALDGVATYPATGDSVTLSVYCAAALTERCADAGDARFSLRSLALTVQDDGDPVLAVGGIRSPAAGVMDLDVHAHDDGLGLAWALATIDDEIVAAEPFPGCPELSPSDETVDLALGAACATTARVTLPVDTTGFADGRHTVEVWVLDAADNASLQSYDVEFANAVPGATPTPQVLAIGSGSPAPAPTPFVVRRPPIAKPVAPAPAPLKTADLVRLPKRVSGKGVYTVSVLCPATTAKACAHRLTLKAGGKTLATARGTSKPGRRAQVALELTAAARRTLARRHKLTATLTLSGAAPTTVRLRG